MEWARGQPLFEGAFLRAFRTSAVDGQPAELWTLNEKYGDDPTFVGLFADAALFLELYSWQSAPALVAHADIEMVVVAPPWVPLPAISKRARERGGLAPAFVLSLVRDLARDIATAPRVALRSLSPTTIAVSTWGRPRLLDFTLAKFPERRGPGTTSGVIKGDIAFMSPENALGRKLDHRSDIFALGLVAFELLTGVRAVEGGTELDRLIRLRDANLPFDVLREAQPDAIASVVERMLRRSLGERIGPRALADTIEREPAWSWTNAQMFDEVRRIAPDEVDAAILYGI